MGYVPPPPPRPQGFTAQPGMTIQDVFTNCQRAVGELADKVRTLEDKEIAQQERIEELELDLSEVEQRLQRMGQKAQALRAEQHRRHPAWEPDDKIIEIIEGAY